MAVKIFTGVGRRTFAAVAPVRVHTGRVAATSVAAVHATYLAFVHVYVTAGTRVPGPGTVAVVQPGVRMRLTYATVEARKMVGARWRLMEVVGTVCTSPRRRTEAEVGARHVNALTYSVRVIKYASKFIKYTHIHCYRPTLTTYMHP